MNISTFGVDGWLEAKWTNEDGEAVVYRFPESLGRSEHIIKIAHHIDTMNKKPLYAKSIHWTVFRYHVSRSTINRTLKKLNELGFIEKSDRVLGRNSLWRIVKKIGITEG